MTTQEQLTELEALAAKLNIKVCYEPMAGLVQGVGGLCRVKGHYRIIIDRRLKPVERLQIVSDCIRRFDTSELEMTPFIRKLLA